MSKAELAYEGSPAFYIDFHSVYADKSIGKANF